MGIGPFVHLAGGFVHSLIPTAASTNGAAAGTGGLSPFAQILGSLQQLQQSNPTQYQSVTQQISTNLQTGAQSASANGNTVLAGQLARLSTDFTNASTSGQLPNVPDLASAVASGGHHHVHSATALPANAANSTSALAIIDHTLSSAGIPVG
jgi:hypothetical protein